MPSQLVLPAVGGFFYAYDPEAKMNTPDPAPDEPGNDGNQPIPVQEPDDGSTEGEEGEGEAA